MSLTLDEALARLRELTARLDAMADDDPARPEVEARRDEIRLAAQEAADGVADSATVRRELEHLEQRLARLQGRRIRRSLVEHGKWFNDPSAYARRINEAIEAGDADEREALERRIARLRRRLEETSEDGATRPDEANG